MTRLNMKMNPGRAITNLPIDLFTSLYLEFFWGQRINAFYNSLDFTLLLEGNARRESLLQ